MRTILIPAVSTWLAVAAWLNPGPSSAQEPTQDKVEDVRQRIAEAIDEVRAEGPDLFRVVTIIDDDDEDDDDLKAPPTKGIPARTRAVLRRAYQAIRAADDDEDEDDEDEEEEEHFVDAAESLYAAAIRAAQAGEPARAGRLARAAIILARTPELLEEIEAEEVEAKAGEGAKFEGQVILIPEGEGEDGQPRVRLEIRKRVETPEGEEDMIETKELHLGPLRLKLQELNTEAEAAANVESDDAGPVVGVGLAIGEEDDAYVVNEVLPGSPADEEGTIRKGDRVVGVKTDDGVESFEGKDLPEVVGMIRGESGSEIRLVIRHEGDDEDLVVTLTRKPLRVPASVEDEPKKAEEKPDGDDSPGDDDDED